MDAGCRGVEKRHVEPGVVDELAAKASDLDDVADFRGAGGSEDHAREKRGDDLLADDKRGGEDRCDREKNLADFAGPDEKEKDDGEEGDLVAERDGLPPLLIQREGEPVSDHGGVELDESDGARDNAEARESLFRDFGGPRKGDPRDDGGEDVEHGERQGRAINRERIMPAQAAIRQGSSRGSLRQDRANARAGDRQRGSIEGAEDTRRSEDPPRGGWGGGPWNIRGLGEGVRLKESGGGFPRLADIIRGKRAE